MALDVVLFDEGLLRLHNLRIFAHAFVQRYLLCLRRVLDQCLLELVFGNKGDKLLTQVREFNCLLTLFVLAHEAQEPVLDQVKANVLQVRAHSNWRVAAVGQRPLNLHLQVLGRH